jgi:hypothetical protein
MNAYNKISSILDKEWLIDKTLSFGCCLSIKLWWQTWNDRFFNTVIIDSEYIWDTKIYYTRHPLYKLEEKYIPFAIDKWELEIIWHDWGITELLRWAKLKNIWCDIWENWLLVIYEDTFSIAIKTTIQFDLSKYLQDQDNETCLNPLLDLMKEIW